MRARAPMWSAALLCAGALLATQCDTCAETKEAAETKQAEKKAEQATELSSKAKAGKSIFASKCRTCHTIGEGKQVGPDLAGVTERRDRKWLHEWIKQPTKMAKTDPLGKKLFKKFDKTPMPPQGLDDKQIAQVLAYIEARTEGAKVADKPEGKRKFADKVHGRPVKAFISSECGGCHNPKRTGATGPNITKKRLVDGTEELPALDREAVRATITHGRQGTSMPAWSTADNPTMKPLSKPEINAIVQYLFENEAPEEFKFSLKRMKDSHEVLVPESKLPDEPTHDHPVDDLLLVTEREAFRVGVLDGDNLELVTHMEAGARAHGYTFHPNGRFAYNLGRDGWLYKYDLYQLEPTRKIRVGLDARGIAIDDEGKYLLTGMYIPTIAVMLDADTLEPLKVFDTHDVENPKGKTVDSRICSVNDVKPSVGPYFLMALKEAGQVWRINYEEDGFPVEEVKNVGEILHDGFLRHDNEVFFLASQTSNHMAAIDVRSMEIEAKIETGKKPHPGPGAVWTSGGTEYAATPHIGDNKCVIWDTHAHEVVGEVSSGGPGLFVRTNKKMKYVWFDSLFQPAMNEIVVFEKDKPFKLVKRIMDGTQTMHPEPDADGDYVFVSDWQDNVVRVYDDETLKHVKTIENLETPTGIFSVDRVHEVEGH